MHLCKSNGTLTGTSVITDLGSSPPGGLTNVNGMLFLQAYGQLWKSDGTPTGTVMVKNIYPYSPINVNGTLFFNSFDSLWKSDGTLTGTVMVHPSFIQLLIVQKLMSHFLAFPGQV